jgi:hypothetical protein
LLSADLVSVDFDSDLDSDFESDFDSDFDSPDDDEAPPPSLFDLPELASDEDFLA